MGLAGLRHGAYGQVMAMTLSEDEARDIALDWAGEELTADWKLDHFYEIEEDEAYVFGFVAVLGSDEYDEGDEVHGRVLDSGDLKVDTFH